METEKNKQDNTDTSIPKNKRSELGNAIKLTLLTMAMLWFSQEPVGWSFLSWFALVPWVVATVRYKKYLKMAAVNLLCGTLYFIASLYWLSGITGPGLIALCIYLGLYFVICGFILRRIYVARRRWWFTFCLPIIWVGQEYLRGTVMTGFPWLFLSHTLIDYRLAQVAEVIGAFGVTFLAAMVNGLLCDGLLRPLFDISPRTGQRRAAGMFRLLLVGIIISGSHLFGVFRINAVFKASRPGPSVTVVQDTIPQFVKDSAASIDEIFDSHINISREAAADDTEESLIIWPETIVLNSVNQEYLKLAEDADLFIEGFKNDLADSVESDKRLAKLAADSNSALLVGTPGITMTLSEDKTELSDKVRTNSAVMYKNNGDRFGQRYDKIHRVPFGEYVPFKESIPWLNKLLLNLTPYDYDYSIAAGTKPVRFEIEHKTKATEDAPSQTEHYGFAVAICYEDVIPDTSRMLSNYDGVDFLVNISNDGWYVKAYNLDDSSKDIVVKPTSELMQHWAISRYRAIENRIGIARSVNCGISGFIKPDGSVQTKSSGTLPADPKERRCETGYLTDYVWIYDGGKTIYARTGDIFALGCTIIMGIILIVTLKKEKLSTSEAEKQ